MTQRYSGEEAGIIGQGDEKRTTSCVGCAIGGRWCAMPPCVTTLRCLHRDHQTSGMGLRAVVRVVRRCLGHVTCSRRTTVILLRPVSITCKQRLEQARAAAHHRFHCDSSLKNSCQIGRQASPRHTYFFIAQSLVSSELLDRWKSILGDRTRMAASKHRN